MGKSRMCVGNSIRLMCRSPKSREGDHFQAATGWAEILEGFKPQLPDFCFDKHTTEGRRKGRGIEHFREHGAKLVPAPAKKDKYEDRAYKLWTIKQQRKTPTTLFDE